MDVLKKIRAATLIETLTASVLIVIVLMVASLILNNIFLNTVKKDRIGIENRLYELQYLLHYDKIQLPYFEDFDQWEIAVILNRSQIEMTYTKDRITKTKIVQKERMEQKAN